MSPRISYYLGCEVRLHDCFMKVVEKVPNCQCFETMDETVKTAIRAVRKSKGEAFCVSCQSPVDVEHQLSKLKFNSPRKLEAESNPEGVWPNFLQNATAFPKDGEETNPDKQLNPGFRVFPLFHSSGVRRDVVLYGCVVWSTQGVYNGDIPNHAVPTVKYEQVRDYLSRMGLFHAPSFRVRLYMAMEPGVGHSKQYGDPLPEVDEKMPRFAVDPTLKLPVSARVASNAEMQEAANQFENAQIEQIASGAGPGGKATPSEVADANWHKRMSEMPADKRREMQNRMSGGLNELESPTVKKSTAEIEAEAAATADAAIADIQAVLNKPTTTNGVDPAVAAAASAIASGGPKVMVPVRGKHDASKSAQVVKVDRNGKPVVRGGAGGE
jgi:hypothetical protein